MAIEALFEEMDDREAARRTLRLGINARLGGKPAMAATVANISTTGMLIETDVALAEGEAIVVELPEAGERTATVVWSDSPVHGCRFDRPLSPAEVSAAQLRGDALPAEADGTGEDFGERIHRLRTERGLSLADIADRLGVSKPTVWAWEHGKSRPVERRLPDLAKALGVTPGGLEPAASGPPEILERSRRRIAEAYGVELAAVRIMIEL